jgi:hypothetical protein
MPLQAQAFGRGSVHRLRLHLKQFELRLKKGLLLIKPPGQARLPTKRLLAVRNAEVLRLFSANTRNRHYIIDIIHEER